MKAILPALLFAASLAAQQTPQAFIGGRGAGHDDQPESRTGHEE